MTAGAASRERWTGRDIALLGGGLLVAIVVRALLLPTPGLPDDLGQFVAWAHDIAVGQFGRIYDQPVTFGPVMVYVWGLLAALDSGFRTAVDSSDPAIRAVMKTPAALADIGLALGVAYALRSRPRWAVIGALVVALHPAVIDTSAWWGQYESVYVLGTLVAVLLATEGHDGWAAVALAVALMTKPQVVPFLVPFAAWFFARGGWLGLARAAAIGAATAGVLWVPFLAGGGPLAYLRNLGDYQNGVFAILSLRAWNAWWLVQVLGPGGFVADNVPIVAGIALRHVALVVVALLEILIARAVLRSPTPRTLILALAASTLVAFSFLTTMHERYGYAAIVFFALLLPDVRARWASLVFGIVFPLNLLAAVPPTPEIGQLLPAGGGLSVVGAITIVGLTLATLAWLGRVPGPLGRMTPTDERLSSASPPTADAAVS